MPPAPHEHVPLARQESASLSPPETGRASGPTPPDGLPTSDAWPEPARYAVFWLDLRGRVSRWSEEATALFGLPAPEALGRHFRDFFGPLDREKGRPEVALASSREQGSWEDVGWRVTRDGTPFWAVSSLTHVRTPNGLEIGHQVVVRDLSVLTSQSPEGLLHPSASRLLSVGRVAASVAHDLSNILAAVRGFAAALERHMPLSGASMEAWQGLVHTCDRGTMVMRRLLDVGRGEIEPESESVIDLAALVRGLEPLLRQVLPDRILLVTSLDEDLQTVAAREPDLELILLNLVVNARDAIVGEGTIAIEARRAAPEGAEDAGHVLLAVRDSGEGMDPDTQERAFEPFFTTKGGQGTGLGLALVRNAALACGGSIRVESRKGGGTRVTVRLRPADEPPSQPPLEAYDAGPVLARRRGSALVCVEDPQVREVVASLLKRRGLGVVHASDADRLGTVLREHGEAVDVAVVSAGLVGPSGSGLFDDGGGDRRPRVILLSLGGGTTELPVEPSPTCRVVTELEPDALLDLIDEILEEPGDVRSAAVH